jgi:diguanylate cyclase (GGDEF)-like protein
MTQTIDYWSFVTVQLLPVPAPGAAVRIVVVDPSRTILKAVSRLLERDGHVVSAFVDGAEALDCIKSAPDVSALITSAELTSMSGLELCWEVRLISGRDRAIYIILMSSNSEPKHLINALDSGADDFISKPPASEELYARLRSADRLLRMQRELIRLAMIDPLTGVFNRRAFFEKAAQISNTAIPSERSTAIMFDVDHFKRVNDTYGHDIGDEVLRAIGRVAPAEGGMIGRLGGEEFAVLLERSNERAGLEHAERLRAKLAAQSFETPLGRLSVTCSFGVAECRPGETVDQVLKRADAALYKSKNAGRNCVNAAQSGDPDGGDAQWSGQLRSDSRSAPEERKERSSPLQANQLTAWSSTAEEDMTAPLNDNLGQSSAFVLDDEPQIGALVCKVLEACGLAPRQFTSPAPFLAELEQSPPGLVVLDLSLGQSDAVEIIRHLEISKYRGKVLLISGRDEATLNEIAQIGEKHGLVMLPPLKKPFRPGDVKQRLVSQAADAARSTAPAPKSDSGTLKIGLVQVVEALRNNWLELWYQPKIDLKSGQACGAEGLIRARHPLHGIITPDHLLPPAGDPDYRPLTEFVVKCAMADWARFAQRGLPLKLSINAPVSVIHTPAFITLVRSALPDNPNFGGLIIEVTEDELIRDSEWAHEVATQLKLYNVDLSIDDFGAGYASLSRLNDLPFAEIKIDRSFVSGCASSQLKYGLCQTVVDLAHRFGATACAEGVETNEDLRAVMAMQCDTAQGFLFAKPMPAADFTEAALVASTRVVRTMLQASIGSDQRLAHSA